MPSPITSQGVSFPGVSGATKVSIKKTRNKPGDNKLDSSTLAIAHGGTRTYENGLTDNGPGNTGGIVVTAAVEFLSSTKPTAGSIVTYDGVSLKCTDSELTDSAGELKKGTANYTSDFVPEEE